MSDAAGKPIRLSMHAREQCADRGATEAEVAQAIREGDAEPGKHGRIIYRYNFAFNSIWQGRHYAVKQ